MPILKDNHLIDSDWRFIADDSELPEQGDITVSLSRWQNQQPDLNAHNGKVGIRLTPSDAVQTLSDDLTGIHLIELDFPAFTDGRLFSHAQLLRSAHHYTGELRAVGQFMPDQLFYLSRVGVNAFQLDSEQLPLAQQCLQDFSVRYQGPNR
jgi:uncharacterized protein (DUF934 family)